MHVRLDGKTVRGAKSAYGSCTSSPVIASWTRADESGSRRPALPGFDLLQHLFSDVARSRPALDVWQSQPKAGLHH